MRVLILTESYEWGGKEVHTRDLVRTLVRKGHQVAIVEFGKGFFSQGGLDLGGEVGIRRIDAGGRVKDLGFRTSRRIFRKLEGDVCVYPKGWFADGNWRFDLAARLSFPRYVTIEHSTCEPVPPRSSLNHGGGLLPGVGLRWYRVVLERRLHSIGPSLIVCVSRAARERLMRWGFPGRKLTTVHNGVDPERYRPDACCRAEVRRALGIPEHAMVFGSVGRLCPVKGYDVAIRLFRSLLTRVPGGWLILAGEGPERGALEHLAAELEVETRVRFVGFTDRPWEIYSAMDVFLLPSRSEGLPLSLTEAMACGCCPIAMGVGGVPEVIANPSLGWVVRPGDEAGFLGAMQEAMLAGPERLARIGANARFHIDSCFNAKTLLSALADLIVSYN